MKHKFIPLKARKSPAKKVVRTKKKRKGAKAHKKRSNATNYLLYMKRLRDAELLRGDPELADRLILSSRSESPYYSIVLTFRKDCYKRPNARKMLENIMDSHESVLFAGLDLSHVCRYWVLHTDHDRFELHLIVVNLHLTSGKALKLAWKRHFGDRRIFNVWQELVNIIYQLPSPFDPANERLLDKPPKTLSKKLRNDFYEVDRKVAKAIQRSHINDRSGIVKIIEELDGYTAKPRKDYIQVTKESGGSFRLRGRKYKTDFDFQAYYADRDHRADEFCKPETVNQREEDYLRDFQNLIEERRSRLPKDHASPKEGWKPIKQKPVNSKPIKQKTIKHDELRTNKTTVLWSVEAGNSPARKPGPYPRGSHGLTDRNQQRERTQVSKNRRDIHSFARSLRRISFRIKVAKSKMRRYLERREEILDHLTKPSHWALFRRKSRAEPSLRPPERLPEPKREVDSEKRDLSGPAL